MVTPKQKIGIASIITTADELAEQHVTYTEQFVARANDELYKLLGGMMALCLEVEASKQCDQIIAQMRKTLRSQYQIKTQKTSLASSIVVRYVIRSSRKTAHVYGRVIRTAIEAGITAEQLPDYIREKGGIDAIRQKGVDAEASAQATEGKARAIVSLADAFNNKDNVALGTVNFEDGRSGISLINDLSEFQYLICKRGHDGGTEIVGIAYPSAIVEERILARYIIMLGLSAKQYLNEFWQECKDQYVNMDTVISWRQANGLATPVDALDRLVSLGQSLKPGVATAIREAEATSVVSAFSGMTAL
ncbi:MAG: hypothetical protein D4R84_14965 [Rhodocyclaceae bacterium]|nr:MAG: hypothetical protein D4R84_14965 [Rhodocyclaceae bacterium]